MNKRRKEVVAMLLAGGQGSRLKVLTENTAKPAIPFGGKYRIIDFPLSNCVHSGIDTVGILTQYQPLELNSYIGNGQPWGLNLNFGGAHILPPYAKNKNTEWYQGTANAIFQNMQFIDMYNPEYIIILSGDHIYKMNYAPMLDYHKVKKADCTIAVIDVPVDEAGRFGIMELYGDGRIKDFEEKPENPKSTKASMGIYIFNWRILKKYLILDDKDESSSKDFGKDIIPRMLKDEIGLYAYSFDGYWKDVGTIDSLWEANMDLLNLNAALNLKDKDFKIYARSTVSPASYIAKRAHISNSIIADGCSIKGDVVNSIIFSGCIVEKDAVIRDSVIMPESIIKQNADVRYSILGEEAVIQKGAKVGEDPYYYRQQPWGISVIGKQKTIAQNSVVLPMEVV